MNYFLTQPDRKYLSLEYGTPTQFMKVINHADLFISFWFLKLHAHVHEIYPLVWSSWASPFALLELFIVLSFQPSTNLS